MRSYWTKIALGSLLIFAVGFGFISAGRHLKHSIESDRDITIPFGSFVPFKLDGMKVGTLRSLVIRRTSPKVVTGFAVRVRLSDAQVFEKLQDCNLTVDDPLHLNERTTFSCLSSEPGYQPFGDVTIDLQDAGHSRRMVRPLLLSEATVREFRREGSDSATGPSADSIAAEVGTRVRDQARAYADSLRVAELEKAAQRMKDKADAIRARTAPQPPPAGSPPKTPGPI
jgi:hypothetical protein